VSKTRLDVLLVERGLCESREKARGLILSGLVTVNGQKADKTGHSYPNDAEVKIIAPLHSYVSRGGLKLEKAIKEMGVSVENKVVLDIGASTGGFTDCALQQGAKHVVAVDVGSGQLAWKLRNDPRVTVMEKTNARYLTSDMLGITPELATVDVSFISLKHILPMLNSILQSKAEVVALIKPQFEAGKDIVSKGRGVVRDIAVHIDVIRDILQTGQNLGWTLQGLTHSPITGPEGNIEFIAWWVIGEAPPFECAVDKVVQTSHKELGQQ